MAQHKTDLPESYYLPSLPNLGSSNQGGTGQGRVRKVERVTYSHTIDSYLGLHTSAGRGHGHAVLCSPEACCRSGSNGHLHGAEVATTDGFM